MAELATIARPYAEALFKVAGQTDSKSVGEQLAAIAAVTADSQVRQFADSPRTTSEQVYELIASVAGQSLSPSVANLLKAMIENGRLPAVPEVAAQFHALASAQSGIADAIVYSAYPIEDGALADVVATLEKRFGRKLSARVEIAPELIGGIRVVVGDEVLDTSVKARLEQMKVALTA